MKFLTEMKSFIKDDNCIKSYDIRNGTNLEICIPLLNAPKLFDLSKKNKKIKKHVGKDNVKPFATKFDAYVPKQVFDQMFWKIANHKKITVPPLEFAQCQYFDVNGRDLLKIKICFSSLRSHDISVDKNDNSKSFKIMYNRMRIFQVKGKTYVHIYPASLKFSDVDVDYCLVDMYNYRTYREPICAVQKLKQGYKPYIDSLDNEIKNKKLDLIV